jgi:predicted DNA-binding protein with PD1-like motif
MCGRLSPGLQRPARPPVSPRGGTGRPGHEAQAPRPEHRRLSRFALVLDTGDELFGTLLTFARERELTGASLTGIGAFSRATLGFFDWERKECDEIPVEEQVEVLSLAGDVSLAPDGDPQLHLHVVLGKRDGTAVGGHLLRAEVWPTLEIVLVETPASLVLTL